MDIKNKDLVDKLKTCLASTFSYYLKAHYFHWNVEGSNFPQYHEFLKTIYEDAFEAVDDIAERIRTLDAYAPGSLMRFQELSKVDDQLNIPTPVEMLKELETDNRRIIGLLTSASEASEEVKKYGVTNYLQGRIEAQEKLGWMIKATIKASK
jgi:starvation-inducible DNA-binding protein